MAERSEIVDLYMRDMLGFLGFMKLSQKKFCKRYRLNHGLFSNLQRSKHTPTIETIEKCYRDMDEEGFFSERRKHQMLIKDAESAGLEGSIALIEAAGPNPLEAATLIHEARAGNMEKVISMARQLADE